MNGLAAPGSTFCNGRPLRSSSTGATHQYVMTCRASVRPLSYAHARFSCRCWPAEPAGRSRARRLQVSAALFEPPPFQPSKLTVQYLPGASASSWSTRSSSNGNSISRLTLNSSSSSSSTGWCQKPTTRCYTLTHNDVTGALQLSIGADYNQRQVQGFYSRILRDEITAEWYFTAAASSAAAASPAAGSLAVSGDVKSPASACAAAAVPAELHIYCHVSGEERWLAPPQLRNFIFRREMTLVLDTFAYADKEFLQAFPDLLQAKVYVHFQSDVQELDLREYWGVLGDRRSWRRMPRGVLERLKLLLFGFPALPHQRPRSKLTRLQQLQQQQRLDRPSPAALEALAVQQQQQQQQQGAQLWLPLGDAVVEAQRPVASSLQDVRQSHAAAQHPAWQDLPQASLQQQQQQQAWSSVEQQLQPQPQPQVQQRRLQAAGQSSGVAPDTTAENTRTVSTGGNGSESSSSSSSGSNDTVSCNSKGAGLIGHKSGCSSRDVGVLDSLVGSASGMCPPSASAGMSQLQQQSSSSSSSIDCVPADLVQVAMASGQQLQQQQPVASVQQDYWLTPGTMLQQQQQQESLVVGVLNSHAGSSSSSSSILPVLLNEGRFLQPALQQQLQQQQRQGLRVRVVPVAAGTTTSRAVSEGQTLGL